MAESSAPIYSNNQPAHIKLARMIVSYYGNDGCTDEPPVQMEAISKFCHTIIVEQERRAMAVARHEIIHRELRNVIEMGDSAVAALGSTDESLASIMDAWQNATRGLRPTDSTFTDTPGGGRFLPDTLSYSLLTGKEG